MMKNILTKLKPILICISCLIGMLFIPSILSIELSKFGFNEMVVTLMSDMLFLSLLLVIFYFDVVKELKIFFSNFFKNISSSFKWYFLGVVIMVVGNLIINNYMNDISDNETLVRSLIYSYPFVSFFCVSILAPLIEELVFRKSVINTTKNKYLGSFISASLFGLAHVFSYLSDIRNLLYIVPYFALGFIFSMMDYETKTTFTSVFYHALHNTISFILILSIGSGL